MSTVKVLGGVSIELLESDDSSNRILFLGLNDEYFVPLDTVFDMIHEIAPSFPLSVVRKVLDDLTMLAITSESTLYPTRGISPPLGGH